MPLPELCHRDRADGFPIAAGCLLQRFLIAETLQWFLIRHGWTVEQIPPFLFRESFAGWFMTFSGVLLLRRTIDDDLLHESSGLLAALRL
jgi:hypothetical protein